MYKDLAQLTAFMESPFAEMDLKSQLAMQEGLKTREWKEMKIAKLERMIR